METSGHTFLEMFERELKPLVLAEFGVNLAVCAVLALLLGACYVRFGYGQGRRRQLARDMLLVSLTTMLIITVVQSSLPLSLGLVGALSIVRFRTPIKDPEELAFLFVSIALGVGVGAGQRLVTAIGLGAILLAAWFRRRKTDGSGLVLSIESPGSGEQHKKALEVLERHCAGLRQRRLELAEGSWQADWLVSFESEEQLRRCLDELAAISLSARITVLDADGF